MPMDYDAIRRAVLNANPDGLDGVRNRIRKLFDEKGGRMTHRQWIEVTALYKRAAVAILKAEMTRSTKRHIFLKDKG